MPGRRKNCVHRNWKQFGPAAGLCLSRARWKKAFRGAGRLPDLVLPAEASGLGSARNRAPCRSARRFQNTVSNTALSPDGLPNYGLRSIPQYIAGVNTPDSIININDTRLLARGFNLGLLDPESQDGRVQDWNLTIEKEIMANTVAADRLYRQLRRQAAAGDPL